MLATSDSCKHFLYCFHFILVCFSFRNEIIYVVTEVDSRINKDAKINIEKSKKMFEKALSKTYSVKQEAFIPACLQNLQACCRSSVVQSI